MEARTAAVEPAANFYIRTVKRKLATGTYQTEPVACFCGSTSAQLVTDLDRYGIPHAVWLCKVCGIIYANPRMTEASYAQFYAEEYRQIYDDPAYQSLDPSADAQFIRGQQAAEALQTYLAEEHHLRPSVVFDIGCNAGEWLGPFLKEGAEVHGVDYGPERISTGRARGLPIDVGSIESLEVMGQQADLIIMNHVLEHATNLESMLARVRGLLKDDGMLYVSLPGLFFYPLETIFQNAHPWQFTAETLIYVMECCGFEELRVDHTIVSLWKKSPIYREKAERPAEYIRDIANHLYRQGTRFIPKVRTVNKFPRAQRKSSIAATAVRGVPEIGTLLGIHADHPAVVISGGPSIDGQIKTIISDIDNGALAITIERMYPWCLKHGIVPDYVVVQDASEDVTEGLQEIRPGSTFLVASQCQASVFEAIGIAPTYFFHTCHDFTNDELPGPTAQGVLLNAGGSVTLCSLSLAMLMGIQNIHLFGFDCHITAGGYAKGIAGVGEQTTGLAVKIDGQAFRTTPAYLAFAQQFFDLYSIGKREALLKEITVYGDSLVTAMCDQIPRGDV